MARDSHFSILIPSDVRDFLGCHCISCTVPQYHDGPRLDLQRGYLLESVVFHPDDVASPAELDLQQRRLDTDGFSTLEDLNVGDVVVPLDVEDDAQADVSVIEDPRLLQKSKVDRNQ